MDKKIAIIGASGVVGRALLEHLHETDVPVTGFSRRAPDLEGPKHVSLDLTDRDRCREIVHAHMSDATHLVYAALFEKPTLIQGWRDDDQMQTNLSMLRNVVSPLLSYAPNLRHISLLQGTKAYGAHIMPMRIPGKEREPRVEHENFYWLQEDYLKDLQTSRDFSLTIWRPQIIFGHALGAPMNMIAALGVYGALCASKGEPLHYPGGPSGVMEAIDADLLARAITFGFDNPAMENETFNITNGDVFRWQDSWPAIARHLYMEAGEAKRQRLSETCYNEIAWARVVDRFSLEHHTVKSLVGDSFQYADALFNAYRDEAPPPSLVSTIKLRQAGFGDCIDTEDMFGRWFDKLRNLRLIPPAPA